MVSACITAAFCCRSSAGLLEQVSCCLHLLSGIIVKSGLGPLYS
jgi:hypothetical protein